MEIMIPSNDFDFNSARSTPCATAPSTPKRFGEYYFSAPPSPGHLWELYRDCDDFFVDNTKSCSDVPIKWEERTKPASRKQEREKTIFDDDFVFDVGREFEKMTLPAEELFDGGKIRPLKPPTKVEPRKREDRFEINSSNNSASNMDKRPEQERGRERTVSLSLSSSRRGLRSLSPYRVSKYPWEEEEEEEIQLKRNKEQPLLPSKPQLTTTSSSLSSKSGSRKWRLKDFFLFRSASEGRASNKDPLRKYTALFKKNEEKKISSGRMSEGGSVSKRRVPVSAHELHYTKNRAISESLKKKTPLPYKQGIWGRWFL